MDESQKKALQLWGLGLLFFAYPMLTTLSSFFPVLVWIRQPETLFNLTVLAVLICLGFAMWVFALVCLKRSSHIRLDHGVATMKNRRLAMLSTIYLLSGVVLMLMIPQVLFLVFVLIVEVQASMLGAA